MNYFQKIFLLILFLQASICCLHAEHPKTEEMRELIEERNKHEKLAKAAQKKIEALSREISGLPPIPDKEDDNKKSINEYATDLGLRVRRSVVNSKELGLPAQLQIADSSNDGRATSVNLGVSIGQDFRLGGNLPASWSLLGDYHYNPAASSPQDTYLLGGDVELLFGDMNKLGFAGVLTGAYKRDDIISGEGEVASFLVYPVMPALYVGGTQFEFGQLSKTRFVPYFGGDYESGNGASSMFRGGDRSSFRLGAELSSVVLPSVFSNRLTFDNGLHYWDNFDSSGLYSMLPQRPIHFVSALSYWFNTDRNRDGVLSDKEQVVGISLEYVNGDNPVEGAFDKNDWTLGLSVKF